MTTQCVTDLLSLAQPVSGSKNQAQASGEPFRNMLETNMQEPRPRPSVDNPETASQGEKPADLPERPKHEPDEQTAEPVYAVQEAPLVQDRQYISLIDAAKSQTQPAYQEPAVITQVKEQPQILAQNEIPQTEQTEQPKPQAAQAKAQTTSEQAADIQILSAEEIKKAGGTPGQAQIAYAANEPGEYREVQVQARFNRMIAEANRQLEGVKAPGQDQQAGQTSENPARAMTQEAPEQPQIVDEQLEQEPDEFLRQTGVTAQQLTLIQAEEAAPAVQTGKPAPVASPAGQVGNAVLESLGSDRSEFEMQLNPEELGKVNVKMVMEDGKLAILIMAESARAAQALREQSEGLMSSLRIASIQIESVQVVQQSQSSSGQMNNAYSAMSDQGRHEQDGQAGPGGNRQGAAGEKLEGELAENNPGQPQHLLDKAV